MFSSIKYRLAKKSFESDMKKIEEIVLLSSLYNIEGNEIELLKVAVESYSGFDKNTKKTFFDGNLSVSPHNKDSYIDFSPESLMDAYKKISHYLEDDSLIFKDKPNKEDNCMKNA